MSTNNSLNPAQFEYLNRILTERLNASGLENAQASFEADFDLLRYELSETQNELSEVQAALREAYSDLTLAQNLISQTQDRLSFVTETLTDNLRRPWRAVSEALRRRLAYVMSTMCGPFSKQQAQKFKRSAEKRNPRRYQNIGNEVLNDCGLAANDPVYAKQTSSIIDRFQPEEFDQKSLHLRLGSGAFVRAQLETSLEVPASPLQQKVGFSIVTPYYAHESFFVLCAKSVMAAIAQTKEPVEWVIFNDDPAMPDGQLLKLIPEDLHYHTRIVSDGLNHGIAVGQNKAISAAKQPWIVLLDCDDLIEPHALKVLSAAINSEPLTRYFTSSMIDIDKDGKEMRRRKQEHPLVDLFESGMVAGHMVAIRKDLHEELGGFDVRFSGVQDYDFALRVAAQERITRIPEHLYQYRWHSKTQSVSSQARQAFLSDAVRSTFLREAPWVKHSSSLNHTSLTESPGALSVIRTQGGRMDLLMAAIASVRQQDIPMTPCIVVHGTDGQFNFVKKTLSDKMGSENLVVLHADEKGKRRGYPCNVALDYLQAHRQDYDLLCFLDDDDHYLPNFGSRMVELLRATDADLVYGMTNALPTQGHPIAQHGLLPAMALLAGNFITFNSFMVRSDAVFAAQAKFDETLHYLEDYDFLIQILASGARFEPLMETVAEYRLLGDGNAQIKNDNDHYEHCAQTVRKRARAVVSRTTQGDFWANMTAFPTNQRKAFNEQEMAHLGAVRDMFKTKEVLK